MVLKRKLPSRVETPEQPAVVAAPEKEVPAPAQPITPPPATETPPAPPAEMLPPSTPAETPPPPSEPEVSEPAAETQDNDDASVAPVEVSRPDDNRMKRRRDKKPRSFASPVPEQPSALATPPPAAASAVPQTDVEFDKVMERLSSLGVVAPETDTLTQKAAPASAVAEAPLQPVDVAPVATPTPSAPKPSTSEPDWLAALTKELEAASKTEARDPRRDALGLPPPPTLPGNLLSGLIEDEGYGSTPPPVSEPTPVAEPRKEPAAKTPESAALPPSAAPTSASSQSDVPWADRSKAAGDDWQLDMPNAEAGTLPPGPTQPADIYAGVGKDNSAPPWQQGKSQPAELPGPRAAFVSSMHGGSPVRLITTAALLALVIGGGWWLVSRPNDSQEQLARWTGSLRETTERLPSEMGGAQDGISSQGIVQPEQTIAGGNTLLPPPDDSATLPGPGNSQVVIDFADVPPTEANKPIVADGSEDMPEGVSFVASLQKAIAEKKAEKSGEILPEQTANTAAPAATTGNNALDKTIKNTELKAQLDAELAAYRKALVDAGNVAEAPRPGDFLGKSNVPSTPYMNAASTAGNSLLPPPAPMQTGTDNPGNLPVLAEPSAEAPRVRTLEDFDVSMFEPEKDKIRIPRGIKPRLNTSDFPEMEVLSMVPGKGLIAYHNGTEGVLLLGESIDGWQLVQVSVESAEFRNGRRSYYVSAE